MGNNSTGQVKEKNKQQNEQAPHDADRMDRANMEEHRPMGHGMHSGHAGRGRMASHGKHASHQAMMVADYQHPHPASFPCHSEIFGN